MKPKILILCTGNSCRSQMAEGYLRHFAGHKAEIYSAGIEAHGVNPRAIATMNEDGIDISNHTSNNVSEYAGMEFDYVITVCDNARENCPYFPAQVKMLHHNFPDPARVTGSEEKIMHDFRNIREMIRKYAREFSDQYLT
jgi:arsenate reductase (thioredoxin)